MVVSSLSSKVEIKHITPRSLAFKFCCIDKEETTVFGLQSSASSSWLTLIHYLEKPVTGLFLTAGLFVAHPYMAAQSSEAPTLQAQEPRGTEVSESAPAQPMTDGIYLYGQSPEPDQIGSAYMVFQVEQGQVVGAFYMPRSSFDCFQGDFHADQLALTVINSYEQTRHPYAIALEPTDALATTGTESTPVTLEGFHAIENVSDNDLRILSTCQASYPL